MYKKGMTTRQISYLLEDIYGFGVSEGFISDMTDKIIPQIEDWQRKAYKVEQAAFRGLSSPPHRRNSLFRP